jgi:hypothetical protein
MAIPTYGLGPVAKKMNLGRGEDPFSRIVSFSSNTKGHLVYVKKFNKLTNLEFDKLDFKGGDMNTSIIETALGRTIMVLWGETSPPSYSRQNLIQGALGALAGLPNGMAIKGVTKTHHELTKAHFSGDDITIRQYRLDYAWGAKRRALHAQRRVLRVNRKAGIHSARKPAINLDALEAAK